MADLKDSGARREFPTGAVRDIAEGKGRMDLMPLRQLGEYLEWISLNNPDDPSRNLRLLTASKILKNFGDFVYSGDRTKMYSAISEFSKALDDDVPEDVLALKNGADPITRNIWLQALAASQQMEDGARKYSARNFEKGMNSHCFIDSGVRHLLKWVDGWKEEPHYRAMLWNCWALLFTLDNHPDLNDLPFAESE